jgi:Ig-like domain-containing protein/Regulator of Chromosome Condensation (RCC1) repeat protein/immunoglobulin I-set domain protein
MKAPLLKMKVCVATSDGYSSKKHAEAWIFPLGILPILFLVLAHRANAADFPIFTNQPVGRSVPAGLPTTFTAAASGISPIYYQWQLNGSDLPGGTNTFLTIPSVGISDLGQYHLVASNSAGISASADAQLTFGPVAAWGQNASLECLPPPGLSNVVGLAAGDGVSVALLSDGTAVTWGAAGTALTGASNLVGVAIINANEALALESDGSLFGTGRFALGAPVTNQVAVAASSTAGIALQSDGTVLTEFSGGQGPNNTPVPGFKSVASIGAGSGSWGVVNSDGSIGGVGEDFESVPAAAHDVAALACGSLHASVVRRDGTVFSWSPVTTQASTNFPADVVDATSVSCGFSHTAVLRSNGTVVVWGSNSAGQTNVPAGLTNVCLISAGGDHCLALVQDGSPLILSQPVGATAFTGREFTFQAKAAGAPPLAYQWLHDGTNIAGATSNALALQSISAEDSGIYQVAVSNSLGTATSLGAPLQVKEGPPFFRSLDASSRPYAGTPVDLGVPASGSVPIGYQWYLNGVPMAGATNEELTFSRIRGTNGGQWSIRASNQFGSVTSAPVSLRVLYAVVFAGGTNIPNELTNITAISAQPSSYIALRNDGTAFTWGRTGPTTETSFSNLVEIAMGSGVFGLTTRGTVAVSGVNAAPYVNLTNILALESDGAGASMLLTNGNVLRITTSGTASISPQLTNIVALIPGGISSFRSAAINSDGVMYVLGDNGHVSLVRSNAAEAWFSRFVAYGLLLKQDHSAQDLLSGSDVATGLLDVGGNAGVRLDSTVVTWNGSISRLTNVPAGLTNVIALDAGNTDILALLGVRDAVPISLSEALDTAVLFVSSKSSPQWYAETNVTHDGANAARSAEIGSNTGSSMRTFVNGPLTIRFWWKVSSETNHDFLTFSSAGVPLASISGEQDWQQVTFDLPAGPQILVWSYSKDASGSAGSDAAWVDQVEFIAQPPQITAQSSSQSVQGGSDVNLSVVATGTPPLNYQWIKDGTGIAGATTSMLTLPRVERTNSGIYSVIVTNSAGSVTSSNLTLRVLVPQRLTTPTVLSDGSLLFLSNDRDGGLLGASDLANFRLQVSSNLTSWVELPNAISLTNGFLLIRDTNSADVPARFYRIVEQ